jgi:hypothetical protein
VKQVRYINESGPYNSTSQLERYFFMIYYEMPTGSEWKIDISFWLGEGIHPEPVQDALEQQLTPETRLAILWIKNVCHQFPTYRDTIYSVDIYDAVVQHGVRNPKEFASYLTSSGRSMLPKRHQ